MLKFWWTGHDLDSAFSNGLRRRKTVETLKGNRKGNFTVVFTKFTDKTPNLRPPNVVFEQFFGLLPQSRIFAPQLRAAACGRLLCFCRSLLACVMMSSERFTRRVFEPYFGIKSVPVPDDDEREPLMTGA